ncbi:MAG TPA: caspase family protein, partial [Longimicrobiales bacterium]|nr:caspase family protein [Longimicrobiales bacterium]
MIAAPEPGARRALLIGIDDYQHEHISKLKGCVNDVRLMKSILEDNFGFEPGDITTIENEAATRENLLATFDRFVGETGQNDIVVIHYAGHGSLITDREGDEPSGYDSTIMPIDSPGWRGDNKDISDDEIHLRLARLAEKTPYITLIFDCCHSGTISRDDFGDLARTMPPDMRPVSELPPSPIPEAMRQSMRESGPSGWLPLTGKYVLVAGCRDEEVSYEYRPPEGGGELVHGALTYFLTGELRQATSGTTYRDVFERAAAKVNANNNKQHPQMEGTSDREIFGVRDLVPMRFVRVASRDGQSVELAAGAALGATVGSKYEIHPQGTKNTESGNKLGDIEITKVGAVTSRARILSESTDGSIVADCRAFETEHAYTSFSFGVQVAENATHAAELAELRARIDQSRLVRPVDTATAAAARIYALSPRTMAEAESGPVPQLGQIAEPVFAVVNADGQLAAPLKKLDQIDDVVFNLEMMAKYRQALLLENPDPDSAMRGKFALELLRLTPAGEWVVAEADAAGGQIVYNEGDRIAFRVRSLQDENDKPGFVTLLDFGLRGTVEPMYPAEGAGEKLRPTGFFEFGTDERDNFSVGFPDGFPFTAEGGAVEGVETIKLIVTSSPVDFHPLAQSGFRAAMSPLMALWNSAMAGPATREIIRNPVKPEEDWTTVTKSFVLRRRNVQSLTPGGPPVAIGGVTVGAVGLAGEVEVHPWGSDRAVAAELQSGTFGEALGDAGIDVRQTIEVGNASEVASGTRSGGPPTLELSLREPEPGYGQMVMTTDELGVISWHFSQPPDSGAGTRGGASPGARRQYSLPGRTSAARMDSGQRGLVGAVGRKFLKELVFPLIDPVIGAVTNTFVASWEGRNRPYRVRSFSPDDFATADAHVVAGEEWNRLGSGRALMLVHGTFSRAHSAFGGMPRQFVESLHGLYDGRVFAVDHFTLSHDPKKNVSWFLEQLPPDTSLDLDIICHSRGGLVSRVLTEKQSEFSLGSRRLKVGKVIFVGTPNAGTVLADSKHIGDLIDTFTNLANFVPDVGVSDIIAGVIAVAKQLAVGAFGGLPGLQAMVPDGKFAADLNAGDRTGDTRYFALASDYSPGEPGLSAFA